MFLGTFLAHKAAIVDSLRCFVGRICILNSLRTVGLLVFLFVSCVFAGEFGQKLSSDAVGVTALRLPTGISLAALLILGYRYWPAIFLGAFVVNLSSTHAAITSLGIASGNTLDGLLGAYLVQRCAQGAKAFFHTKNVIRFVLLAGVLATVISATIGVAFLCQSGFCSWRDFPPTWLTWWEGDALASIVITPFLVLLLGNPHHSLGARELAELLLLLVGLMTVSISVFGPPAFDSPHSGALVVLCIPFSMWAAFRFCPLEAAGANFLLCGFVTWSSLTGHGPFASTNKLSFLLGLFVAVTSAMTLVISAFQFQRRSLEEDLTVAVALYKCAKDDVAARLNETAHALDTEVAKHLATQQTLEQYHHIVDKIVHQSPRVIWVIDRVNRLVHYVDPHFEDALSKSWERRCNYPNQHVWPLEVTIHAGADDLRIPTCPSPGRESSQEQFQIVGPDSTRRSVHRVTYRVSEHSENPQRFESVSIEVIESVKCTQERWSDRKEIQPAEKLDMQSSIVPPRGEFTDRKKVISVRAGDSNDFPRS
jgi:integral membrane sensor domain MASE1